MTDAVPSRRAAVLAPPKTTGPLRRRAAGQSVMEEVLAIRATTPAPGVISRFFGARPLPAPAQSWYSGALGERAVGRVLARLGPEWTVLHAVPVGEGSSDIDHVVIGPSGVFTINTKHHPGARIWTAGSSFMVNRTKVPYIRDSVHEAARAGELLSAAVLEGVIAEAVIVVVDSDQLTQRDLHESVTVLTPDRLLRWLTKRPASLSPGQVSLLSAAAAQPGTWSRTPPELSDPADVVAPFDALVRAVNRARRRRLGWLLTAPVVVLASAAGVLPPF
jgi:hypothetical protein